MIVLVTNQKELFQHEAYTLMTVEDSLKEMQSWNIIQLDSETTGKLMILDLIRTFIRL